MKRFISVILAFILVLSMASSAFAAEGSERMTLLPAKIDSNTVWSYLDDNTDPAGNPDEEGYNRTAWAATDFDDSLWNTGKGSFGGAKSGDSRGEKCGADNALAGCDGTNNYPTYYFRTKVNIENASAVTSITGTLRYDDAAIIYINGKKAIGFNDDSITGNSSYSGANAPTEYPVPFTITDADVLSALHSEENVIAVEVHNSGKTSSDILFNLSSLEFSTEPLPLLSGDSQWSYLDDNTDPAGNPADQGYDRTSWAAETFDDTGWKKGTGSFGAKKSGSNIGNDLGNGFVAKTRLDGIGGADGNSNNYPAYFFRTTFNIDSLEGITKLKGTVQYDDGVVIYINGNRAAAFSDIACDSEGTKLGHGFDANLQYGGDQTDPATSSFEVLADVLHTGTNTIAVEVHNNRATSSDIWFCMTDLSLSDEEVDYQNNVSLSVGSDESELNFTWYSPLGDAVLTVAEDSDMTGGTEIHANTEIANDLQYSCKATVTGLKANTKYYYQLSNGTHKSDVYNFSTDGSEDFSFAFVADPQLWDYSQVNGWEKTLDIVSNNDIFKNVSFMISAGDQVNDAASEEQYDYYLDHDALLSLPVATVIGNHDSGSNTYKQHFNIANESSVYGLTAAGGDYWFRYNNALFMVLNSNNMNVEEHEAFMRSVLSENDDADWKIVAFHHTVFTVAGHSRDDYYTSDTGFKSQIVPLMSELGIDMVLQGHDHVYCRTYIMNGLNPLIRTDAYVYENGENNAPTAADDLKGVLYVTGNSGSGSKCYEFVDKLSKPEFCAVRNQENTANISKVSVSQNSLNITTYRTSDMGVVDTFTINHAAEKNKTPAKLLINQIYGTGENTDTPISRSFVELYNPTDADVNLDGYKLVYDSNELKLKGTVPAGGPYLITGAKKTDGDTLTYDLPEADQTCEWVIDNKKYNIVLRYGETEIDAVKVDDNNLKVSKQKSIQRNNHFDSDNNTDFRVYTWKAGETEINADNLEQYAPYNSKGKYGNIHDASPKPDFTPVVTGDTRVKGYYDAAGSLNLELAGRYNSGAMNEDGGSLEIVAYNPVNGYAYAVSGVKGKLIAVDLNGKLDGDKVVKLSGTDYDLKTIVSVDGFTYGDMTSVAISPDGTKLAAAIQAANYADKGVAALFACNEDGSLKLISTVEVGVQPDMITFADSSTIMTADEGEPRQGTSGTDPKGSVTIVTIGSDNGLTAKSAYFDCFDSQRDALAASGVLIQKGVQPSTDFEPEYIAVSDKTAYVSLQEANAIAVLNIASGTFTGVYPLGFQDYGTTKVDLEKNGKIELKNYNNVYGIKMPDGISVTTIGGKTYILTANEGDSWKDWENLNNEFENKISPTGDVTLDSKVVWFKAEMWDGLDKDKDYIFGGRSFSIYEVTADGLNLVFDSGSEFEEVTADKLPDYFNASNDNVSLDNRSGKKGPEPESVITGKVGRKTYAFIAMERIGGIMVYDITNPANTKFVNYINSREFDAPIQGDVSPEGLCFIPASDSQKGKTMLLAACEVSGTLAVYQCDYERSSVISTYTPEIQHPTIVADGGAEGSLNYIGTTATIIIKDGYELLDVKVNGVSQGKVTELKNLKTGDKIEIVTSEIEKEPTKDEIISALGNCNLIARSSVVKTKSGKTGIKITWKNADGETMKFDGVEIYRSTKKNSGYGKKPFYVTKSSKAISYTNTRSLKAGIRYYYKVRGFVIIDGQKYYTDYSTKAIRTAK